MTILSYEELHGPVPSGVTVRHGTKPDTRIGHAGTGDVRDPDVLAGLLEGAPPELHDKLPKQRALAGRRLATTLASDRYLKLLARLDAARQSPPFFSIDDSFPADVRADEVLPSLVGPRWRALRRQVRKGGVHPSDQQLHRIRIKAKQLRYAAETASSVVGRAARHTASAAEEIQTVLGEHHDAVAAEAWLREHTVKAAESQITDPSSLSAGYEAGILSAGLRWRQRKLRQRWLRTWKALTESKRYKWLD